MNLDKTGRKIHISLNSRTASVSKALYKLIGKPRFVEWLYYEPSGDSYGILALRTARRSSKTRLKLHPVRLSTSSVGMLSNFNLHHILRLKGSIRLCGYVENKVFFAPLDAKAQYALSRFIPSN